jgi:hypothetical protein
LGFFLGEGEEDGGLRCDSSLTPRQKLDVGFDPGCWRTGTGWNAGQLKVDKVCWANPPLSGPNRARPPKLFFLDPAAPAPWRRGQPAPHGDDQTHDRRAVCCEANGGLPFGAVQERLLDFIFPLSMCRYAMGVPEGENAPLVPSSCSRDRRGLRAPGPCPDYFVLCTLHKQHLAGLLFKSLSVVAAGGRFRRASAV